MEFVRGVIHTVSANFLRPNNTTAYSAGQVLSDSTSAPTILKFPNASKDVGGAGTIVCATVIDEANQATKPDLQLWLFDTAPAAENDASAFSLSAAESRQLVDIIAFPVGSFVVGNAGAGASGNCFCNAQSLWLPFNTIAPTSPSGAGDNALYGMLIVRNAYTPIAQERFDVRLQILD